MSNTVGEERPSPLLSSNWLDVSLYGDNLSRWQEWLASQEQTEWLLRWGIRANKAAVAVSLPLWILATVISLPLSILSLLTGGLLFWPFHLLLIRPLTSVSITLSAAWEGLPILRPLFLVLGPLVTAAGMMTVSLIPDGNIDHKRVRLNLFELWPLSRRRLLWIRDFGNGKQYRKPNNDSGS